MRLKGSYTVEAAIIIPIFLFILALGMRAGLILFEEIRTQNEEAMLEEIWVVDDFYRFKSAGEIIGGE